MHSLSSTRLRHSHTGGALIQGGLGDDCVVNQDGCMPGLFCDGNNRYGVCRSASVDVMDRIVVKKQKEGGWCNVADGFDACSNGYYCLDERYVTITKTVTTTTRKGPRQNGRYLEGVHLENGEFQTHRKLAKKSLGTCMRFVGRGQTCWTDFACGPDAFCDGLGRGSRFNRALEHDEEEGEDYSPAEEDDRRLQNGGWACDQNPSRCTDCSNSRSCSGGYNCRRSGLNGSDRWYCDDGSWNGGGGNGNAQIRQRSGGNNSPVLDGAGVCVNGGTFKMRSGGSGVDAIELNIGGCTIGRFADWRAVEDAFKRYGNCGVSHRTFENYLNRDWNGVSISYANGNWGRNDYGVFDNARCWDNWYNRYCAAPAPRNSGGGGCNGQGVTSGGLTWGSDCSNSPGRCLNPMSCCTNGSGQYKCCTGGDCEWA